MESIKLGSLFDGIGGFPLSATFHGITPVWASEIEKFPIEVTKIRFPNMKHLGDITNINGAEIEPVDIITFGSPCQDLSVAGKREGLVDGKRSNLFYQAVRIIREMREATNGKYPTFAVWENVPGAFSSNGGQDFRSVLEEITESEVPMPQSGKWATAGMVRGNGRSAAWRILDAQYWGVPQRRKRIFLVADFAGQRAGEILFEQQSVSGDIAESRKAREEVAAGARDGVEGAISFDNQTGDSIGFDVTPSIRSNSHGSLPCIAKAFRMVAFGEYADDDTASAMKARDYKDATDLVAVEKLYDMTHADEVIRECEPGVSPTLNARMGTGGNQIPIRLHKSFTPSQFGQYQEGCGTLRANGGGLGGGSENLASNNYTVRRLTPTECERLQGFPDNWTNIPGASDTGRYKALGNSVAVPCVAWIIGRIKELIL